MIDELVVIRCRNYEAEPEICEEDCGVIVPESDAPNWILRVIEHSPEWFIVFRSCPAPEHSRHADPFCSLTCFTRFHARHEHGDD